jgi:hypothetical protein
MILPTPFILSQNYRLRSIREAVLFLFDLKQKARLYPEALEPPPPLTYVPNSPKSRRLSEALARKASLNIKLIPPSIRPFAAEILLAETIAKKEAEKLTGLRKIHQLRRMRSAPKPPPGAAPVAVPVPIAMPARAGTRMGTGAPKNPRLKKYASLPPPNETKRTLETRPLIPIQPLSERSLQTSTEMISAPHSANTSDPLASLSSHPHPHLVQNTDFQQDYSDTDSNASSDYLADEGEDDDEEKSPLENVTPFRPSEPPPSSLFLKRRQNIVSLNSTSLIPLGDRS